MHPKLLRHFVCCGLFPVFIFASSLKVLAATKMVKDINPGGNSAISFLTNVNGTLFFRAHDGVNSHELWKSDGTEAGTVIVRNIHPTSSSNVAYITNVQVRLSFGPTTEPMVWSFGRVTEPKPALPWCVISIRPSVQVAIRSN